MARVKLSEFRAKSLIYDELRLKYEGVSVDLTTDYKKLVTPLPRGLYVVKVDQAVKKRGKSGLVFLKLNKKQIASSLEELAKKGYRYALIEPFVTHEESDELYFALSRTEQGIELSFSSKGGVDVEADPSSLRRQLLGSKPLKIAALDNTFVEAMQELFLTSHMTLLEINPLLKTETGYLPLDAAVEVDSAAEFFVGDDWSEADFREAATKMTPQEQVVEELKAVSPASFNLKILNSNGSIFLLLSGGGASVVVADELASTGDYKKIANYGEYSGNPSEDETFIYTREVISLMLRSKAPKKVLLIAGGVANFTDVAKTFGGIIRALKQNAQQLKKNKVKVYVRRGGPNQEAGLKTMQHFLTESGLSHEVHGPEYSLAEIAARVAKAAR